MGRDAARGLFDSSWNRLSILADAQTGSLPTPKSGSESADGTRQTRTNCFLARVFSRRGTAPSYSDWTQQRGSVARARPPALLWSPGGAARSRPGRSDASGQLPASADGSHGGLET